MTLSSVPAAKCRGLPVGRGQVCGFCGSLRLDKQRGATYESMFKMFDAWRQEAAKLEAGEIKKEEYDKWRYRYPEFDTTQKWVKVPSQKLSDMLVKKLKKNRLC